MKTVSNIQIIFYILLFISIISNAQTLTLTLEESLEIGLRNSKELSISESQINKAEAVIGEFSAAMLPKISLNANYSRLSKVPPFKVNLPILPGPFTLQESYFNNYFLSASIEQPLFTGFRLSSLKSAAEYNKSAEEFENVSARLEKVKDIETSFWHFYISKQIVVLVKQNLIVLKDNLRNTESLLENGLATKNDLLKLKVELGNAELKLIEAQNNLDLARASFNKAIGMDFNSETDIKTDKIEVDKIRDDLSDALSEAEINRQELKSVKLKLNALDEMKTAAQGDWYPQLFAFGNFYYNNPNQRFLPLEDKFNDSWDIGIGMKWKVWDWGGTSAKTEQVKQDYLITENNLKLLSENIQLEVYNNYLGLQKSLKKIKLSELQVESAEENYRITVQKYYQQLANSTELIDAETSLLNAKITLVTSKVEYIIGLSDYRRSLGRNAEYR